MRIRPIDPEIPEDSDDLPAGDSPFHFDEDDAFFCPMALKELMREPSEVAAIAELGDNFPEPRVLPTFARSRRMRP